MSEPLVFQHLVIDPQTRRVHRRSETVDMTDLGFELLLCLARNAPEPVSNEQLAQSVWQQPFVSDQTIAQRVAMVRRALGDDATDPRYIRTVRGKGYAFVAPRDEVTVGDAAPRKRPWRKVAGWSAAAMAALVLLLAIAWQAVRPPPIMLDPENGALRLDNADASLGTIATAQVRGRSVLVVGLAPWSMVTANPAALGAVCSLRRDPSQFTSAIDPALRAYLDDPAKDADCEGVVAEAPPASGS
ncbi:winged helix-turn-helix domain-containing protein [Qipengyuania flava]|uniref:winged helix-turn-helix domain-containing protein n=1 Tax=Qipengyuania flava TaxID=192812 RepID=UPI001C637821|nr:winged helix-turn-helix domain-containing protein [Qipengyuania flava]QYJ06520.1 winged helix-turn-helix domain-containing protein [Qipengyuania flava]